MEQVVFADCETTGVLPTDRIVELAYTVTDVDLNEIIDSKESLIDPEMRIPSGASAVHHITNAQVEDEPTIGQLMHMHNHPLKFDGETLFVAHNASFDMRYFKPWMGENVSMMCTLRLAKRLYPGLDSYKLQALKYSLDLGEVTGDAHRAGADVDMLIRLVQRMMADTSMSIVELHTLSLAPLDVATMPFGKHKNKTLAEVPRDYIKWLLNQDNVDPDLRVSLEKHL